jgi:hypothetical protein
MFAGWPCKITVLLLPLLGGCQSAFVGLAPAGPGVATASDLTPWLASATETQQTGCLMEFNVPSEKGSYDTWGLAATVVAESAEVDVRACPGAAEDFRGQQVIVKGKLILRGTHHLPLLRAEQIIPADDNGNPLPDPGHHVALAPEPDPITDARDPITEFQTGDEHLMASAN